jgi:CO dehydrogenase nickel-insertion accessory protein CooC1
VDAAGLNLAGCVPEDELISSYDIEGRPTAKLPDDATSVQGLNEIFEVILSSEDFLPQNAS